VALSAARLYVDGRALRRKVFDRAWRDACPMVVRE
jgi:hypothetical protein